MNENSPEKGGLGVMRYQYDRRGLIYRIGLKMGIF